MNLLVTNGCFDLLHIGHVESLRAAREAHPKHWLIVGLNGDESVRSLKGGRCINDEATRKSMLLALSCVDDVVVFDQSTATNFIKRQLGPCDIYFKGPDYSLDKLNPEERAALVSSGCQIVIQHALPRRESTTQLIERIAMTWGKMNVPDLSGS